MRICVFGTGSVGGYFGGRLAQAGEDVTCIARGEHLCAMREHGLHVDSLKGDFILQPVIATDDPEEVGPVDCVLLGVKAWQVPEAAKVMKPLVGVQTCVQPLQNGVDAPNQLAEVLGKEHVMGGLCQISALIAAPGHIRHIGIEPTIAFGELDNHSSERTQRLLKAYQEAGVRAEIPADIHVAMWEKFLFIAAISGVGAVTRAPAGVVRTLPETRQILLEVMQEVLTLAHASGVALPEDAPRRKLAFIDGMSKDVMASMQRDILEGRPSELHALLGAVVRMGQEMSVPTPVCRLIYSALLPQEMKARREISF